MKYGQCQVPQERLRSKRAKAAPACVGGGPSCHTDRQGAERTQHAMAVGHRGGGGGPFPGPRAATARIGPYGELCQTRIHGADMGIPARSAWIRAELAGRGTGMGTGTGTEQLP